MPADRFEFISAQGLLLAFILWMTAYKQAHVTEKENNEVVSWERVGELVMEFLTSVDAAGESYF